MKKLFTSVFAFLFILATTDSKAQLYDRAIGVRLGTYNGITYKTKVADNHAIDFSLNYAVRNNDDSFYFTGLYEVHADAGHILPNLLWFYGAGGSIGSRQHSGLLLAVDGVIGLDYKFEGEPINISLDWKPALELAPAGRLNMAGVGISVRYTF